jgi:hypothetical protein
VNEKAVMARTIGHDSFIFSMPALSANASKGVEQRNFVRFCIADIKRHRAPGIAAG